MHRGLSPPWNADLTVVDMSFDQEDLGDPLRGNRFAAWSDRNSKDSVEQAVVPNHEGDGRKRRLVLVHQRPGEEASQLSFQERDLDADSIEGASDIEVEEVVEPTVVAPFVNMELRVRAPSGAFTSLDAGSLTAVLENRARVMRSVPFVMRERRFQVRIEDRTSRDQ